MWQWNDGTMELYHYGVLGMKWGHHKAKVYANKAKRARANGLNGDAKEYEAKSRAASAKVKRLAGSKASERVRKQSAVKTAAQVAVFGSYGAMKYNQLRANHVSRGKAALGAYMRGMANQKTGGALAVMEPRIKRRKKK